MIVDALSCIPTLRDPAPPPHQNGALFLECKKPAQPAELLNNKYKSNTENKKQRKNKIETLASDKNDALASVNALAFQATEASSDAVAITKKGKMAISKRTLIRKEFLFSQC